ncbi:MAG: STAS domain-containing protein [Syntrophales bacterium]
MEFLKEHSGTGTVRLEGDLNIQDAGRLRETFVRAFSETEALSVNLDGVTSIDIACMQVLCSAHKTFTTANKFFAIRGCVAPSFERSVMDAGYARTAGCPADLHHTCLWVIGGSNG